MARLKPNKPPVFNGKYNEFAAHTCIYQFKQDLDLIQVGNALSLEDEDQDIVSATFLGDTAAAWWYTRAGSNKVPRTWGDFENALA